MFISVLELFKIGIGPSSSHTLGPMVAAHSFIQRIRSLGMETGRFSHAHLRCTLKGSLAFTGKGHATDRAITLGVHGYLPANLPENDLDALAKQLWASNYVRLDEQLTITFNPSSDIVFDYGEPLPEHPNGMIFELLDADQQPILAETCFSIGGGFISSREEITQLQAPLKSTPLASCQYPFDSASAMLQMAQASSLSIAQMKRCNELGRMTETCLDAGLDNIWQAMRTCIEKGLHTEGVLPGGLNIPRRAKHLYQDIRRNPASATINDWLCAYAMAVNEENAAGNQVVTAPTNGAAGVIPAVLYYFLTHENGTPAQVHNYLLTASAIGGLIKHRSSISGAEVGCQGEVGSAAAMAAAGLCAIRGGTPEQVENAAEIALEHHLGMTCDPVKGLVQVPCIERNGFGAIKAYTAASLALRGTGVHFMPLDSCIAAMKQTGLEMSHKYKETSLGGLAVSITEC
ncbi:L-serine ammonia-lyase [Thiothrix nivea]|uniref:L-serine dehydratase n=1 Tax=Thiothrix nivea (strain ATCC 35100 / DSM 5205 / JP2) TaxID=870187 RepID=A0A656HB20_THINJ|nr:L-serine ammonia-lyase [Thiothrix nivea]EIJ33104.1 L-serine ammonia-lyase [Thiothrix nivea DSM 5205]